MKTDLKPKATLNIDIAGAGRRFGLIGLPWSRNESGWGTLQIPIAIISRGKGPFVLLVAGNHGDEFEGPLALSELARTLDLDRVKGTIAILPALNYPAVRAGTRMSPIDGLNMNRAFRRRRDGSITEQIADFVEAELVSRADAVLDIHAGGKTMYFHPFAAAHKLPDAAQSERARLALLAFGAPIGLILEELDSEGMLDSAVENKGKLFLSTELGGGGSTTPETVKLGRDGAINFLIHTGAYEADIAKPEQPVRLMSNEVSGYVLSEHEGLIEYLVAVGAQVRAGDAVARVHRIDRLAQPPEVIGAPCNGMLIGRHFGGHIQQGDFLALLAQDI